MRVLLIGSGGREHALAWKIKQSQRQTELFIAPGNGGTASFGKNIAIDSGDVPALMEFIKKNNIDFVVPGPELPLVNGIVDACKEQGILCFGPEKYAAKLEASKAFSKEVMKAAGVPTAAFAIFTDYDAAVAYVEQKDAPLVVKADGLAAGKGVVVAQTKEEALETIKLMMCDKVFGESGTTVVIEEALRGEEVSFLAICQGETVVPLPSAQDHKAAFDGDKGPNTGGMGAYSPAPILPKDKYDDMIEVAIRPIVKELKKRGHPFSGVLYAGLMMTAKGPMVLEYNVRFGDPECQPLLMRLEDDLLEIMLACAEGRLEDKPFKVKEQTALCVVMAAEGYPAEYKKGMPISGITEAEGICPENIKVFQAGTSFEKDKVVASGGRVLGVTALGNDLTEAQKMAYKAVSHVIMDHSHFRTDIGSKGLKK